MEISAAAISAAAAVLSAGTSIGQGIANHIQNTDLCVVCGVEIENYTNNHLEYHQLYVNGGKIKSPPSDIRPTTREMFLAVKTSGTATGTAGTVSWHLGTSNDIFVFMWDVPYDQNWNSNWFGAGVFSQGDTKGYYDKMYKKTGNDFKCKEFYNDVSPLKYTSSRYHISVSATQMHKCEVKITIYPRKEDDVPETFKIVKGFPHK